MLHAIFIGLINVIGAGFVLAPIAHLVLHRFHVETAKEAKDKLATETKRLNDKYDTDTAKLKTDHADAVKKLTDTNTDAVKKLKHA